MPVTLQIHRPSWVPCCGQDSGIWVTYRTWMTVRSHQENRNRTRFFDYKALDMESMTQEMKDGKGKQGSLSTRRYWPRKPLPPQTKMKGNWGWPESRSAGGVQQSWSSDLWAGVTPACCWYPWNGGAVTSCIKRRWKLEPTTVTGVMLMRPKKKKGSIFFLLQSSNPPQSLLLVGHGKEARWQRSLGSEICRAPVSASQVEYRRIDQSWDAPGK